MTTVGTAITARLEARFAGELSQVEGATLVRRCADLEELLAAAESGSISLAAVSPDFPGMDGSAVAELCVRGVDVIGVVTATSPLDARQCEAWAIRRVHVVGSGELGDVLDAARETPPVMVSEVADSARRATGQGAVTSREAPTRACGMITVWGPAGAPGRTTCAAHLARELAADGPTLLLDADTVAPAISAALGLLDEAPGVLAAARLVDAGTLNVHQLRAVASHLEPDGFDVLTGIGSAKRWHELTRFHLSRILEIARQYYRWIVLDIASEVSNDEALMFDTVTPSRAAAGLEALAASDVVVALAACDPISLQRFVQGHEILRDLHDDIRVVVSKARDDAVGGPPARVVGAALERFAGIQPVAVIPDARACLDAAHLTGKLVAATGDGADFVGAIRSIAVELGAAEVEGAGARRGRLIWPRR